MHEQVKDEQKLHTLESLLADQDERLVIALDALMDDEDFHNAIQDVLDEKMDITTFGREALTAIKLKLRDAV